MASSITFDFISRGGPELARQFKSTGDNAAAAARGAKILQTAISDLGSKENRTAAESANLARALRLTGDAEDRAAAKALAAEIAIKRLDESMAKSSKSTDSAKSGLAGLVGEITGFGAAAAAANSKGNKFGLALAGLNLASGVLEPALAGIVVAAGGLAAGLASAGAGLGVFSAVAKSVYTATSTAAQKVQTAQNAYNVAVANGVAPAKAYRTEQIAIGKAYAELTPQQITLSKQIGASTNAWQSFVAANTSGVAKVLTQGFGLLPKVFAAMKPFLAPVEAALSGIIGKLSTGLGSSGFKSFIGAFSANSGPAITKLATAIGNVVVGIGGILKAFLPTSQQMLTGIDKITAKFREWGTTLSSHSGFQSLMATFRSETPQAVAILKNLGAVLANVGKAMFGLSSFSNSRLLLSALLPLSGVMASLSRNTDLVRVALYALVAVKIGQQFTWIGPAWKGLVKFAAAADGATIAETIAAAATRAWGLAMDALPWVALAAAVVAVALLVIKYHTQIWHFMIRVWNDILHVISGVWGWIQKNWPLLLAIITGPVGLAILWVAKNFGKITTAVKTVLGAVSTAWNTVWNALKTAFRTFVVTGILGPLGLIIHGAAAAFGWVPGLGGKLQGAAKAFDTFRAQVNASLGGINGRTVNVSVAMTSSTNPYPGGISGRKAAGGLIWAGTGPTADDVPIMASRGELIVPAHMVKAGAVDHLRGRLPGFAAGGPVGVNVAPHVPSAATVESTLMGSVTTLATAFGKAAMAALAGTGPGGMGDSGSHSGSAAVAQAFARSIMGMYHWGPEQWPPWLYLGNQESGWSAYAVNKSSGAYGIGQSLGHGHPYNLGDYKNQVIWMANYIRDRYGTPAAAWAHERANNWYAKGGLVPRFASGGQVGRQGAAYLKAWQTRRGGGFGAAWGPVVVNQQIAAMAAAQRNAQTLSRASGLSAAQRRHYTAAAVDEGKRLAVLHRELAVERTWRGQLGSSDVTLARDIAAAGGAPALAKNVKGWKAQMGRQKATIAGISKMLGYSDAQQAAIAKAHPPPAPTGVQATHTYGGDVTNTIGAFLASVAAPFGAARGGMVWDSGGWLKPGWNPPMFNNTGRPEHLVPSRGGGDTHLHLTVNAPVGTQQQLEDWFIRVANKTAQHGRLSHAVKTAAR